MNIKNLGYRTDCIVRKYGGSVVEKPDYFIIRMPSNPTFHFGNLLLFKSTPRDCNYGDWMEAHEREFGPDSGHVVFGWDCEEPGESKVFEENGFTLNAESVFQLKKPTVPRKPSIEIEIRKIDSDADWKAVTELQILVSESEVPSVDFRDYKSRLFQTYRRISADGHGDWWGAFSGKTLVSDMGLYFDEKFEVGRFQSIETHPGYRKKGICSSLLRRVVEDTMKSLEEPNLIICTEVDSEASRVYAKLGFEVCSVQYSLSLSCPYEKRFEQVGLSERSTSADLKS